MHTTEPFQIEGDDIILGIFGSSVFINTKKGEGIQERRTATTRIVQVLQSINPKLVYITPTPGVPLHLTTILDYLKIPFIIVSPSRGHFTRMSKKNKILLKRAIDSSKSVVVVNDVKATMLNYLELEKQSEEFILESSDLILSVYGSANSANEDRRHEMLNEIEKDVIFLNYAT